MFSDCGSQLTHNSLCMFFLRVSPFVDLCIHTCFILKGGAADGEVGAVTLFGTLMDYHGALQRYSLQIKGRYIEVRCGMVQCRTDPKRRGYSSLAAGSCSVSGSSS